MTDAPLLGREAADGIDGDLYACSPKAARCEDAFSLLRFEPGRLDY